MKLKEFSRKIKKTGVIWDKRRLFKIRRTPVINYFFINPAAGQGKGIDALTQNILKTVAALNMQCEIHVSTGIGDGEAKAREIAERLDGESARFYACGGDGTLNEIINGIGRFENIAVGCLPIGTGNDTVRNFPDGGDFMNIKEQLLGKEVWVDLMEYSGVIGGRQQTRYCVNMFNIGFDCNVVELAGRLKKKPLISGSFAYLLAVLGIFIKKKGVRLRLTEGEEVLADGEQVLTKGEEVLADGEVLLCAIANGKYCGGGLKTSPQSVIDDGFFDVNIVRDVSRTTFLRLFPKYTKGTHLQVPGVEKIINIRKSVKLKLLPKDETLFLCADGEISQASAVEFQILPGALRFIVPAKDAGL